jgi:cytoskeleton protein RodZ
MNDQADNAEQPINPQMVSPGAKLASYRKERGWTVEQVASQLNLAPRQIVAIESDDYPSLPGMPIVRGFIRAYAKLLKVDAAPLLATLGGETDLVHETFQPRKTLSTPFSEARLPSMVERQGISSKWVIGGLVAVLLGVAIWAARNDRMAIEAPKASSPPQSGVAAPETASTSVVTPPQAEAPKEQPGGVPPAAAAPSEQATVTATAPVAETPLPAMPAEPASEAAVPAGKNTLELKVKEDSWIEVRRANNDKVLLSRIVKAGESERVEVDEPVSVVIGNASGVEATLRGTPVELKTKGSNNVARLSLK